MKHTQFFSDFLNENVKLDPSRLKRLDGHVTAVCTFLRQKVDAYEKTERQGSYALGTIIKPVRDDQEYDADILLYMDFDRRRRILRTTSRIVYDCLMSDATYAGESP